MQYVFRNAAALYVETTGAPHARASNVGSPDGSFQTDGNAIAGARR